MNFQVSAVGQCVLVCAALGALLLLPAAEGTAVILPVVPAQHSETVAWLTAADARLVDKGFLPGSIVVWGKRDKLVAAALGHGALVLRIPRAGCSRALESDRAG